MKFLRRLHSLFRRAVVEVEMAEEMRLHLEMQEERNRAAGMSADEAYYAARRQFGGMDQIKERARDQRGWVWLEHLRRDVCFGARMLRKSPGFTTVAVLTLALGIGANTAFFSVVQGVLLRPLPYPEQVRLVVLCERCQQEPFQSISYPNFLDWRMRQKSFTAIGVACPWGVNYVGSDMSEHLYGALASHDVFAALGVAALRGRLFVAADDQPGAERTVVIRESLWKRSFGGRDSALGEKIQLSGEFYTIIGVLPDAFQYPNPGKELWAPLGLWNDQYQDRGQRFGLYAVARLKPGVTLATAQSDMQAVAAQLAQEYPAANEGQSAYLETLNDDLFGRVRNTLWLLLAAAGFVLLIACTNVVNLQLARAHARAREFGIRAALGASRGRVIRQLLTESLLLGLVGCAAGLGLAAWAIELLKWWLPADLPRLQAIDLNGWVLGFAIGASLLTSVAVGLVPAFHATRLDVREALARSTRIGGGARTRRLRATLIVAEFALTGVLLVGAGLLLRTIGNLYHSELGYATEHRITLDWQLTGGELNQGPARLRLIEQAQARLAGLPGVTNVALCDQLPLTSGRTQNPYYMEGAQVPVRGQQGPITDCFAVNGDYFVTLGIPLIAGRSFKAQDQATSPRVAIVDTKFVEKNYPGQDPIGKRFVYGNRPPRNETGWMEIVGVVAHVRSRGPRRELAEQAYRPFTQDTPNWVTFVLRTVRDPASLAPELRAVMHGVSPDRPIFSMQTMDGLFAGWVAAERTTSMLLGVFAGLAVLLAAVGLYGVLSYSVGQRTHEIGIRMALGATSNSVVGLVLGGGLKLAGIGLAIGLAAALGLTHFLQSLLFGVSPVDFLSFAGVALVLTGVGVLACWLPARRATKVNPVEALRAE